jgi:hypothetical protein
MPDVTIYRCLATAESSAMCSISHYYGTTIISFLHEKSEAIRCCQSVTKIELKCFTQKDILHTASSMTDI